jgi:hypothetical protein
MPDSEIIPKMFKVTPKQKAEQLMSEKCQNGYKIISKEREMELLENIKSTVNYQLVNFQCK